MSCGLADYVRFRVHTAGMHQAARQLYQYVSKETDCARLTRHAKRDRALGHWVQCVTRSTIFIATALSSKRGGICGGIQIHLSRIYLI